MDKVLSKGTINHRVCFFPAACQTQGRGVGGREEETVGMLGLFKHM